MSENHKILISIDGNNFQASVHLLVVLPPVLRACARNRGLLMCMKRVYNTVVTRENNFQQNYPNSYLSKIG